MKKLILSCIIFLSISSLFSQNLDTPIKVGIYNNYPKVYQTEDGNAAGIFPEIIKYIATREKWTLQFVPGTWEECLTRLEKGEIDIMVDVAFSEERQELFDFTAESVLISWGCVYSRTGRDINSIPDLSGKTVAVMKKSILTDGKEGIYNLTKLYAVECDFIEVEDYNQVFKFVRDGKAQAGVTNRQFGAAFAEEYHLKRNNLIFSPTQLKYAFTKHTQLSAYLSNRIDLHLASMQQDMSSQYYQILTRYKLYPKKKLPVWITSLILLLSFLATIFIITYFILKWQIRKQTRILQKTNEDLKTEIEKHAQTNKELENSKELYCSFAENLPGLIYMYDQDEAGTRTPVIRPSRNNEFLGPEISELVNRDINNFFNYVIPEDLKKLQKLSEEAEKGKKVLECEYRVRIKDNKIKWFKTFGTFRRLSPKTIRWQGVILDIDERKQTEKELELYRGKLEDLVETRTVDLQLKSNQLERALEELKEADKLKSIFLASMSHELRTPLNSIIGFTGILLMGMVGDLSEEQRTQLRIVKESASHLLDLINDILDISKIEAGKVELQIEEFNLNELLIEISDSLKLKAAEKGIELNTNCPEIILMKSDRRRIKQVIINLVGNAVKFTEEGSVAVEMESAGDQKVRVIVKDTGIGIKPEDMNKLFEPFQQIDSSLTKKYEGTGLGLHLSTKLLNILQGTVDVVSEYGKGTTFSVEFTRKL